MLMHGHLAHLPRRFTDTFVNIMNDDSNDAATRQTISARSRPHYHPIIEAEAGMVLAAAVKVVNDGVLRFSLPAGHSLTEDNLHQLRAHRAEFIFVAEPDTRSDEEVAVDAALAARRVMQIFSGADLTDPNMAALFDKVLGYRSA